MKSPSEARKWRYNYDVEIPKRIDFYDVLGFVQFKNKMSEPSDHIYSTLCSGTLWKGNHEDKLIRNQIFIPFDVNYLRLFRHLEPLPSFQDYGSKIRKGISWGKFTLCKWDSNLLLLHVGCSTLGIQRSRAAAFDLVNIFSIEIKDVDSVTATDIQDMEICDKVNFEIAKDHPKISICKSKLVDKILDFLYL